MSIFETSGAKPQGSLRAYREYWSETWTEAMLRAFPGQRSDPAAELYPYLPHSSAPRSPTRLPTGAFFSKAEAQRGATSPLEALYPGGVAGQKES